MQGTWPALPSDAPLSGPQTHLPLSPLMGLWLTQVCFLFEFGSGWLPTEVACNGLNIHRWKDREDGVELEEKDISKDFKTAEGGER